MAPGAASRSSAGEMVQTEYTSAPPELTERLEEQLDALRQCSAEKCREAEDG